MKKSLLNSVITLAAVVFCSAFSNSAHAQQIRFEGTARFSARQSGSLVTATASVSKVANYSYESFSNVSVRLAFSDKPYQPGSDHYATTVARSTTLSTLAARTYYNNVTASGSANCSRGQKRVGLFLADGSNRILAYHNFKGAVSVRTVARMAKRTLGLKAAAAPGHLIEK
jgi:hypothetical protein